MTLNKIALWCAILGAGAVHAQTAVEPAFPECRLSKGEEIIFDLGAAFPPTPLLGGQEESTFQDRVVYAVDTGVGVTVRYFAPDVDGQIKRIRSTNAAWTTSLGLGIGMDRQDVVEIFGYAGNPPLANLDSLPAGETLWFTNPSGTDDPGAICSTHVTFDKHGKVVQIEMWPSPMSISPARDVEAPEPPAAPD